MNTGTEPWPRHEEHQIDPTPPTTAGDRGATPPAKSPVRFTGHRMALFKLSLVNALLTLLTGGLYRFWAKTRVRRFFWHNLRIDGEPLEYTGTPVELFVGFLIVLTFLIPIFAAYEGGRFLIYAAPAWAENLLEAGYLLTLLAFIQMAVYRMWRFRLTRTSWRGIRFGLDGSTWEYLKIALGWSLLTIASLGLLYPAMRVATWKYRVRHARFGTRRFAFSTSIKPLMTLWAFIYGLPLAAMATAVGLHFDTFTSVWKSSADITAFAVTLSIKDPWFGGGMAVFIVLMVWYRIREMQTLFSGVSWGPARFTVKIRLANVIALLAIFVVIWIGCATILSAALAGAVYAFMQIAGQDLMKVAELGVIAFLVIFLFFVSPIISQMVLRYEIVRHICRLARISNDDVFDDALQSVSQAPKFGEGMADALDVGAV